MRTVPRLLFTWVFVVLALVGLHGQAPRTFRVWVFSDAHVGSDQNNGRESLATALRQSEGASGFSWDIALDLGDMSGAQGTPKDAEGVEIIRQFGALKQHHREDIYDVSGNHDRSGLDEPQAEWWRKWIDPTGEHTEFSHVDATKRPFPIDGTWERYSFRAGNLLFLMMSDINEPTHVLKDTTVASGEWEGMQRDAKGGWEPRYHGLYPQGTPQGASFLYWVDSKPDSGAFESMLAAEPTRVDLWLGAHTHTDPDDTYGGKSHIERRWGTTFINVAGLTRYHTAPEHSIPRSWLLTFTDGSDEVTTRCYLHGNEYAPQGWYSRLDHVIKLSKPFKRTSGRL